MQSSVLLPTPVAVHSVALAVIVQTLYMCFSVTINYMYVCFMHFTGNKISQIHSSSLICIHDSFFKVVALDTIAIKAKSIIVTLLNVLYTK